ncbi:MAG: S8 family serine peptidase [Bacteroidetes bacterium]|nr:S8 family serine peptidase [Bacteroidota bacterium]
MKYLLITIFLLTLGTSNSAQEFGNSNLRLGLFQNQNVRCYVKADTEQLSGFLNRNGGIYFSTFRGWSKIELKGQQLIHLSQLEWCSSIRIEGGKGQILSDTSLINTRTDRVHQGAIQRHPSYTGSGVVMGFVDTGIDFTHPDFKNKDGSTRIVKIWDQTKNADSTLRPSFGYGEVYDSAMINAGNCPHIDNNGHGTQVCGMGAGNGNSVPDSIADYTGHAPNSTIICVNTDFNRSNWTLSIAESIEWIFSEADKLGLPCVVNLSVGTYSGSHDGKDLASNKYRFVKY